jgi:transcriptional regulator with XRE-family HTH domain
VSPKRFKEIRLELDLTQDEAALILGVRDKTTISRYENGSRRPSVLMSATWEILVELPRKDSQRLIELLKKRVAKLKKDFVE